MKVQVNGDHHEVIGPNLSYAEVVALAGEREGASVAYSGLRRADSRRAGTLTKGESVCLEEGMNFSCVMTGNA